MKVRSIDWSGAALVAIAVALAVFGAFKFGRLDDQIQALLVVPIFLIGLVGVYLLKRSG
jgi:hypothetical protein